MRGMLQIVIALTTLAILPALPAHAGGASPRLLLAGANDLTLSISMTDAEVARPPLGNALLDLGRVSARSGGGRPGRTTGAGAQGRATLVRNRVSVLLQSRSGRMRFARLQAFLNGA